MPSSRTPAHSDRSTDRGRNAKLDRNKRQQREYRSENHEPIEEEFFDDQEPQFDEEECDDYVYPDQEPRFDPKEMRDVVRMISPFVRLIEDSNNPFARIVAREICKTYYSLFHPGAHPIDVLESIDWVPKQERIQQLWSEFWLYVPGSNVKEWVPMSAPTDENDAVSADDSGRDPSRPRNATDYDDRRRYSGTEDCGRLRSRSRRAKRSNSLEPSRRTDESKRRTRRSQSIDNSIDECDFDCYCPSIEDMSPPKMMFDHQFGGYDPIRCDFTLSDRKTTHSRDANNQNSNKLDTKHVFDKISVHKHRLEESVQTESEKCLHDTSVEETDTDDCETRQPAGDDIYFPYCEPGPSSAPTPYYPLRSDLLEYYRRTGNTTSPRRDQEDSEFPPLPKTPVEPEIRASALDDTATSLDDDCESDSSDDSQNNLNMDEIACNAEMVANAFANLAVAQRGLQKKKKAFKMLTKNYLNFASAESESPATISTSAKKLLKNICENPPKPSRQFDDSEWNDNAFKDRDFIRLLPFFENVHNQLAYIASTQCDYGVNMLDDIMSTLHHIHYELGDPRLKNELLVDHVKLITRNTWEKYFYKGVGNMPAIAEKPLQCYGSPRAFSRRPSPVESRQPSPVESRQTSPAEFRQPSPVHSRETSPAEFRQPSPVKSRETSLRALNDSRGQQRPSHRSPSAGRQKCRRPNANANQPDKSQQSKSLAQAQQRRPVSTQNRRRPVSTQRPDDDTQILIQQLNNPPETHKNFLRRSQPSGAPKAWAPKLKPVNRPKEFLEFNAKPGPKTGAYKRRNDKD